MVEAVVRAIRLIGHVWLLATNRGTLSSHLFIHSWTHDSLSGLLRVVVCSQVMLSASWGFLLTSDQKQHLTPTMDSRGKRPKCWHNANAFDSEPKVNVARERLEFSRQQGRFVARGSTRGAALAKIASATRKAEPPQLSELAYDGEDSVVPTDDGEPLLGYCQFRRRTGGYSGPPLPVSSFCLFAPPRLSD